MKEIVVISGKGGTGKTSVTASLAVLAGPQAVIADCDVDAADMHLLTEPQVLKRQDFYSGVTAVIDPDLCRSCDLCAPECRFDAIDRRDGCFEVNPIRCEGCGLCARICPYSAIEMVDQLSGEFYVSKIRTGAKMVHARLGIGAENSGKLVARVKKVAREIAETGRAGYVIVDGTPGIGCPVVSSLSGADMVVIVTEPTVSGVHDLRRIFELSAKFSIPTACVINKADLNEEKTETIKRVIEENGIGLLGVIGYDRQFTQSMLTGKTIVESASKRSSDALRKIWSNIQLYAAQLRQKS